MSASPAIEYREPESYFNRVSAKEATLYHPIDLNFTNLFHARLQKAIAIRIGKPIRNKNLPYYFWVDSFERACRIGLSLQLFLPDLISVRLVCYDDFEFDEERAFKSRLLQNHPTLLFVADTAVKIASDTLFNGICHRNAL